MTQFSFVIKRLLQIRAELQSASERLSEIKDVVQLHMNTPKLWCLHGNRLQVESCSMQAVGLCKQFS